MLILSLPFSSLQSSTRTSATRAGSTRTSATRASLMDERSSRVSSLFPPIAHRHVALELAALMDSRLDSQILDSEIPADVTSFENESGTSVGSVDIRYGAPDSSIDFVLESWLHCKVPNGTIDITSLLAYQNGRTDAPHFALEFIQGGPTSLVLLLDLLPRKDPAFSPDYVEKYYEKTNLDKFRQEIEGLDEVVLYKSPNLYVRSVWSPTAITVRVNCDENKMEELINGTVRNVVKEVLEIWLGTVGTGTEMGEEEREWMVRRDKVVRAKSIEIDLQANLPKLFDRDVSSRVIGEIQKVCER